MQHDDLRDRLAAAIADKLEEFSFRDRITPYTDQSSEIADAVLAVVRDTVSADITVLTADIDWLANALDSSTPNSRSVAAVCRANKALAQMMRERYVHNVKDA
jgi:glutamine synthetase type III